MAGAFDRVRAGGTPPRSIALQTRRGRDIPNHVPDRPAAVQRVHEGFMERHPRWQLRTPPNWENNYNCAGHIWASRRVNVHCEHEDLLRIFEDDGYRIITRQEVKVGDLALYYDTPNHAGLITSSQASSPERRPFLHVGQVVGVQEGTPGFREVFILSKWGLPVGEVCHSVDDYPFETPTIEYWTERLQGAHHAPRTPILR